MKSKIIQFLQSLISRLSAWVGQFTVRKPSQNYAVIALSGNALMVWTPSGNIVISATVAPKLGRQIIQYGQISEGHYE